MKTAFLFSSTLLALLCGNLARGQSTINAGGGSTVIGGNEYEYSIGEMAVVSTYESGNLVVTHGVLQPADAGLSVNDPAALQAQLRVFPNPASDVLNLAYTPTASGVLSVTICDIAGRQLFAHSFTTNKGIAMLQAIPMAAFAAGSYMLTARIGDSRPAAFTIQKLK